MILIGEKLNSTIPATRRAIDARDAEAIKKLCQKQEACGAAYLDVNTALCQGDEWEAMRWVIDIALECTRCGIVVDTPDTAVGEKALDYIGDRPMIINSVTLEERVALVPKIVEKQCGVIALPLRGAVPSDAAGRHDNAVQLAQLMVEAGILPGNIYMDILVSAIATDDQAGRAALDAIEMIHTSMPGIHLTCGLSNLSFGLPRRKQINAAFLPMAVARGLDSAIVDVTDDAMRFGALAANAILGRDEYCMEYLAAARPKRRG